MITQDAQVSGARALQEFERISKYLQIGDARTWNAERINSLDAASLKALYDGLNQSTALEQSSQLFLELTDTFCRIRDQRYANRSRKWLYTRAFKTKAARVYELWSAFVKENGSQDLKKNFTDKDPKSFSGIPYQQLLALPEGSTKLAEATAYVAQLTTTT